MHPDNNLYGHAEVLRRYAEIQNQSPIPGQLQHGWNTGPGVWADRWNDAWPVFIWSQRNLQVCQKYGLGRAVPIGAPVLYLNANVARESHLQTSLIAFPQHGWECETLVDAQASYETYAKSLDRLVADGFGPVTVCMYWLEYMQPALREPFQKRKFSIVCNGHRDRSLNFLPRLWQHLRSHAYATSTCINTALLIALVAGCKAFIFGEGMKVNQRFTRPFHEHTHDLEEIYSALSYENFDDRNLVEIGNRELGLEYKLAPAVLREVFGWVKSDPRHSQRHRAKMALQVKAQKLGRKLDRLGYQRFRT